ncbi:YfcE family phosphodiesterase [Candidatus Geothermarchaeota archaeon]|nr:MAG: YfcE family phosphodiesterase [Candidatus Geothermarchaeota archaeon]
MRILVISDTHGEMDNVKALMERLEEIRPDYLIHLGDDYHDIDRVVEKGFKVIRVPGVYEGLYGDLDIPHRLILEVEGWRVLISHTEKSHKNDLPIDLKPEEIVESGLVDVFMHGHTHVPRAERKNKLIFINPGHLKKEDKKGYPPTFALIDFSPEKLSIRIIRLDTGEEILAKDFPKAR